MKSNIKQLAILNEGGYKIGDSNGKNIESFKELEIKVREKVDKKKQKRKEYGNFYKWATKCEFFKIKFKNDEKTFTFEDNYELECIYCDLLNYRYDELLASYCFPMTCPKLKEGGYKIGDPNGKE